MTARSARSVAVERRVGDQPVEQVAEHVGRRQAPGQRVHRQRADVEVGEAVAIVLRLHHPGEQVVGRVRGVAAAPDLGVDDAGQLGEPAADPDAALGRVLLRPRAVQQLLAPVRDLVVVLLGDAQRLGRHRHGQHRAETGHEVATARGLTIRSRSRSVSRRVNGSTSAAVRGVNARCSSRRTRGCSGGSISPRKLSSSGTTTPAPRKPSADENRLGILERRRGVRVARGVDEALHRARHRALGAQPFHQRPHVLGLRRVERVEREIRLLSSLTSCPLSALLDGRARSAPGYPVPSFETLAAPCAGPLGPCSLTLVRVRRRHAGVDAVRVVRQMGELAAVDPDDVAGDVRRTRRTRGTAPYWRGPRAHRCAGSGYDSRSSSTISGGHARSSAGVRTAPGETVLHRMPWWPYCVATLWVSWMTPALAAAYAVWVRSPTMPWFDDVLTIAPPPPRSCAGSRACSRASRRAGRSASRGPTTRRSSPSTGCVLDHRVEAGVGRVVEQDVQPTEFARRPARPSP